jgi:hypothetical protein
MWSSNVKLDHEKLQWDEKTNKRLSIQDYFFLPFTFKIKQLMFFLFLRLKKMYREQVLGNAAIEGIYGVIMGCEMFIRFLGFVRWRLRERNRKLRNHDLGFSIAWKGFRERSFLPNSTRAIYSRFDCSKSYRFRCDFRGKGLIAANSLGFCVSHSKDAGDRWRVLRRRWWRDWMSRIGFCCVRSNIGIVFFSFNFLDRNIGIFVL